MDGPTRRGFLAGATTLPAAAAMAAAPPDDSLVWIAEALDYYIRFGNKQSGGPGDNECGQWAATALERAGFAVEKLEFSVPWFEPARCEIAIRNARATLWPQSIVVPTPDEGVTGRLVRVDAAGRADTRLTGAIALIDLPYGRWSSAADRQIGDPIKAAFAHGAAAAVVITNGPTRKVIALNADGHAPMFDGPVGLLAPEDAGPFLAAAMRHKRATVTLTGKDGRRPAFNVIGRLNRGKPRWIVVSTPRSGWFGCAGERGGGIAMWQDLARWAPGALPDHNLAFLCNSGHEYQYLGAQKSLETAAPRPADTQFWLHLGANLAARDWHEGPASMVPLRNSDSQRYLAVSRPLLPAAKRAFQDLVGLESPYATDNVSAGELVEITAAGYQSVAGVFGVHRFHHVAEDDARCVSPQQVTATAAAFRALLLAAAKG